MPQVSKNPFRFGESIELLGFSSRSLIVIIAFGIVLLAAIGVAIYFYFQYQQTQAQLTKSTQSNEQAALLNAVGKLIVLPTDEQPTVATVSDVNRLKGQQFFVHAKNGDKVLIYEKAQEAILYDPLANKIVGVGPIAVTQATPTPSAHSVGSGPTITLTPISVALYNGTTTVGLAATIAKELGNKMPNVTVVSKTDAEKSTYQSTIVVDLTGKQATQASLLAKILKGNVGKLPAGETAPKNADLLVILGK